jgi:hypothetical protein
MSEILFSNYLEFWDGGSATMRIVAAVLRGCLYASISGLLIGILAFALNLPIEKTISLSAPIGMVAGFAGVTLGWRKGLQDRMWPSTLKHRPVAYYNALKSNQK